MMPPPIPPPSKSYLWKFDDSSDDDDNDSHDDDDHHYTAAINRSSDLNTGHGLCPAKTKQQAPTRIPQTTTTSSSSSSLSPLQTLATPIRISTKVDAVALPMRLDKLPDLTKEASDNVNVTIGATSPIPVDNSGKGIKPTTPKEVKQTELRVAPIPLTDDNNNDDNNNGDDDDDDDGQEYGTENTRNQKKNKKRRKRGKKKKIQRNVSFSTVSIHSFSRHFGASVVPVDGGWPLGLGDHLDVEEVSIDDFLTEKQAILRERLKTLTDQEHNNDAILESRPFDYKKQKDVHGISQRNPLFGPLDEEKRMALLTDTKLPTAGRPRSNSTSEPSPSSTTTANNNNNNIKSRPRSNSTSDSSRPSRHHHRATSPRRKGQGGILPMNTGPFASVDVLKIRNDLEDIRVRRSTDMGCTCRKLTVYLPPTDGTGGKKAAHRRMNVSKVKDELRKRGLLTNNTTTTTSASRHELELLLHAAVERESCCAMSDDCLCSRNGMNCQADACSCWHISHQTKEHKNEEVSVERIKERCGNKFGMYVVDADGISAFRKEMLCQVVGTTSNP